MRPLAVAVGATISVLSACHLPAAVAFSPARPSATVTFSAPSNTRRHSRSTALHDGNNGADAADGDEVEECNLETRDCAPLSRREALGRSAAAALLSIGAASTHANPATAETSLVTTDPTRIELQVETDYLIRVLESYDGDMRKVLAAIVRSPFTTVQIDPPNSSKDAAKDAILRALYSYEAPEDYAEQARWLNIEETDGSFVGWLTKKRYKVAVPTIPPGEDVPLKTTVSLSNLEAGVAAGVLSYPLTYGYYKYEGYREEQEAKARKEAMAAKRAAAAAEKAKKEKAAGGKKEGAAAGKKASPPAAKKEKAAPAPAKTEGAPPPAAKAKESAAKEPKAKGQTGVKGASEAAAVTVAPKKVPKGQTDGAVAADEKRTADAEVVWRRLQAKVAQDKAPEEAAPPPPKPKEEKPKPAPVPVPVAAAPVPVTATSAPAVEAPAPIAPAPAQASVAPPLAPKGNAGMDAYDAYMKQAYAAAAATAPPPAPASSSSPTEPAAAKEEPSQPPPAAVTPPESLKKPTSPFGSYLDNL